MKIKCVPEDFEVTELTSRIPTSGPFSLYQLNKQSLGTLESLKSIRQTWNLSPSQICHAGLKDKQAKTTQLVTIKHGPKRDMESHSFALHFLGHTDRHVGAEDIVGNHFRIVLRSLTSEQAAMVNRRTAEVVAGGFPNYFDSQRFGSLGASKEFVAAAWCKKDFEKATWLALAEYNSHDRTEVRRDKSFLRDNWNNWLKCKANIGRSNRRSVITYLVDHPEKFRKAFALIDPDMRGLYLSAFQSAVWNRMLVQALVSDSSSIQHADHHVDIGDVALPFGLSCDNLKEAQLPLPSARCKDLSATERALCNAALQHYQMTLPEMKISFPRDRWFSRSPRKAVVTVDDIETADEVDELYSGRRKLTVSFSLPRGSYATILIKCLTGLANPAEAMDDEPAKESE